MIRKRILLLQVAAVPDLKARERRAQLAHRPCRLHIAFAFRGAMIVAVGKEKVHETQIERLHVINQDYSGSQKQQGLSTPCIFVAPTATITMKPKTQEIRWVSHTPSLAGRGAGRFPPL